MSSESAENFDLEELGRQALEAWERDHPPIIAIDTETDGTFYPFCVTVAWEGEAHYLELGTRDLSTLIRNTDRWIFHNAKFDLQAILRAGLISRQEIDPDRFEDTETIAHLLDEHQKRGLKFLAGFHLNESTDEAETLKATRRKLKLKKADGYDALPREVIVPYAIKDAEFTYRLYQILKPRLPAALAPLYNLERELTVALLDMELAGMGLDLDYLNEVREQYKLDIFRRELELRRLVGNDEFNPYSPVQILEVLKGRGIEVTSTSEPSLQPHVEDLFVRLLLELRKAKKLYSTYLVAIERERDGNIIRPNFRQHGTRTGRMSSGSPEET